MQTRRRGWDAQVLKRADLRCLPAGFDGPADCHHVVGAVGVGFFLGGADCWDGAEGGTGGEVDGGGVEVGGCDGAHIAGYSVESIDQLRQW